MAQLTPLPLTVSCFSKIKIAFTFLVLAHPGSPGKRAVKRVCMCDEDILTANKQQPLSHWSGLCASSTGDLVVPRTRQQIGDSRAFSEQSRVCIMVSVGRLEQKYFQLATKIIGRPILFVAN